MIFHAQMRPLVILVVCTLWWSSSRNTAAGELLLRVQPAAPALECNLYPGWTKASQLLQFYSDLWMSSGCNNTCRGAEHIPQAPTIVASEDTGFEDHTTRVQDWSKFTACQDKGKGLAFTAIKNNTFSLPVRRVVFAAQGCLVNRLTWVKVWEEDVGRSVSIVSDCATGRMYRPGHDGKSS